MIHCSFLKIHVIFPLLIFSMVILTAVVKQIIKIHGRLIFRVIVITTRMHHGAFDLSHMLPSHRAVRKSALHPTGYKPLVQNPFNLLQLVNGTKFLWIYDCHHAFAFFLKKKIIIIRLFQKAFPPYLSPLNGSTSCLLSLANEQRF